ncbi:uncharacterized protein LOC135954588 [Calliphora vicina]|uniref:uncharacterized protein LOC135954588 n=1 Tax=Calliphora vicina TaxID=7373 RepID=UPI00325B6864
MSCNNTSNISTAAKCFKNIELVTNICKYLNYEQQLQLLQVSGELKYIITNFVWNRKFKEVEVYTFPKENKFFVSNKIDTVAGSYCRYMHMSNLREMFQQNNLLFQSNEMECFFNLNFSNIKKLNLKLCLELEFPLIKKFTNLIYLRLAMTLSTQVLKNVANNCSKLETLKLVDCFNPEGQPFLLDQDLDIQVIKNMTNLKNLIIIFTGWNYRERLFNFSNVKHILNQFNLQHLNLRFAIEADICAPEHNLTYENLKVCKNFEMGPCYQFKDFLYFQTNMLPNFENLSHLALTCYKGYYYRIYKDFFNILLKSCKNLTHLSLDTCCIENFVALPKLQELKLQTCNNLTWLNLKTILQDMHLKSFISYNTQYCGDSEYFLISNTLEKLQCDFWGDELIGLLNFNKKNLKNLFHFNWENGCWPDCPLNLANFAPNLKVLYMQWRYLNVKDCFELKCLEKIAIDLDGNIDIDMCELLQLLKHDNLRELTIDDFYEHNPDVDFSQIRAFETKLQHFTLYSEVFYALADFCLDLLQINGKLSLTCFGITSDLISKIFSNEKFPSRFTCINICGFSIDCASIRNQCVDTMDLVKLIMDSFQYLPEKCYFILE